VYDFGKGKNMNHTLNPNDVRALLKELSARDFLRIGMDEIAYVRAVSLSGADKKAFAIYAADGTQLSILDTMDMAMATLRHNDLVPVTLH
jgi:hypothetical protein